MYLACSWRGGLGSRRATRGRAGGALGANSVATALVLVLGGHAALHRAGLLHALPCKLHFLAFPGSRSRPSVMPTTDLSPGVPSLSGTTGLSLLSMYLLPHIPFFLSLSVAQARSLQTSPCPPPASPPELP